MLSQCSVHYPGSYTTAEMVIAGANTGPVDGGAEVMFPASIFNHIVSTAAQSGFEIASLGSEDPAPFVPVPAIPHQEIWTRKIHVREGCRLVGFGTLCEQSTSDVTILGTFRLVMGEFDERCQIIFSVIYAEVREIECDRYRVLYKTDTEFRSQAAFREEPQATA